MQKDFLLAKNCSQGQKKKKIVSQTAKGILFVIIILAVFLLVKQVGAVTLDVGLQYAQETGLGNVDIRVTIARIIRDALGLLGIITVLILLYAGFSYITSQGDPEKITKAKRILTEAVIGLVIILSAFAIASFILNKLLEATGAQIGGGPPNYGDGGGALGNGIIESHYPARNAVDIARNTSIVVTFKMPMSSLSIIQNTNNSVDAQGKPIFGDCVDSNGNGILDIVDANQDNKFNISDGDSSECDLVNPQSIIIRKTDDTADAFIGLVKVTATSDGKTFVFKPVNLLGSQNEAINYTVELTNKIKKADGSDAFGAFGGYKWSFEVSNKIDLTPPQIVSVIPKPVIPEDDDTQTVPRNMVIQINFNEPINPMTIQGKVEINENGTVGHLKTDGENKIITFNTINVFKMPNLNSDSFLAGEFMYGNGYQTVEFVTNDLCGKNACGGDVFCLPGNANIGVLAKAATLESVNKPTAIFTVDGFDGLVDMADNSLDGNLDGVAKGQGTTPYNLNENFIDNKYVINAQQGDNVRWTFYTNNIIDLVPPEIDNGYIPNANEIISPLEVFQIPFTKLMMKTTLKPDRGYGDGYCPCTNNSQCKSNQCDLVNGYCLADNGQRFVCTNSIPLVVCEGTIICQENHHITLNQPTLANYIPRGYWLTSENNDATNKTTGLLDHVGLGENLNYSIQVGSGVKDLMQNCYQPCAGPQCVKRSTGITGQYEAVPGQWQGAYPSCSIPIQ